MIQKAAAPHYVDVHVGARMRLRRMALGLSQKELADALGITFQQIQKYEKGTNRVTAGRLSLVAAALEAPLAWFFEGLDEADRSSGPAAGSDAHALLTQPGGFELAQSFARTSPPLRLRLLELMRALADAEASAARR